MRLIDADALDFSFDRRIFGKADENYVRGADDAIGVVQNAPTIDPVRAAGGCYCRECKHYLTHPKNGRAACFKHLNPVFMPEDGHCSYSEPKEAQDA